MNVMARLLYLILLILLQQIVLARALSSPEPFSKVDWTVPGPNGTLKCGNDLKGVVRCDEQTLNVTVLVCHCMTFSDTYNTTVVGYCFYSCDFLRETYVTFDKMSSGYTPHRDGQLFGSCEEGYSPPVYSYSLRCVECKDYKYNWLKYIAVAFLPLTVFYIIVVLFRISVTTGAMNGYILISQIIAAPVNCRMIKPSTMTCSGTLCKAGHVSFNMFISLYMIWNLDIFRSYFSDFCLTPRTTTLQAFALEYTIAVYPLLLIVMTYIFVKLHDRYSIVVRLWKPFYWCFARIRREWEMRDSLIGAFSTFLLLSYVKIVNISFDLLTPTALYDVHGHKMPKLFLYYDGTYEYFGKDHLPYAFLALFMLLVFNIFPLVLLCLWPCRCFHKCLNRFGLQVQVLHIFMDTFHGCYRLKPRDCRYFAAFYLLLRIISVSLFAITTSPTSYAFIAITSLFAALLVAIARPYKNNLHNAVDSLCLSIVSMLSFGLLAFGFLASVDPGLVHKQWYNPSYPVLLLAPLYGLGLLAYKIIPKRVSLKLKALVQRLRALFNKEPADHVQPLPYRFHHSEEYPPLLPPREGQAVCVTQTLSFEH